MKNTDSQMDEKKLRQVSRRGSKTAAAAGGCMLVKRDALAKEDGLADISSARIDDVALGTMLKRAGHQCWHPQARYSAW